METTFDDLVSAASADILANPTWQFDYLEGRRHCEGPPWSYEDTVQPAIDRAQSLLDMDTGGGELLRSLHGRAPKWPQRVAATEAYLPSLEIAKRNLVPLGVELIFYEDCRRVPVPDQSFDLVINRHGKYSVQELFRILVGGGLFITQQVGSDMCARLNSLLGAPPDPEPRWDLASASRDLYGNGFELLDRCEHHGHDTFDDIGAVTWYLMKVPWQVPDFTVERYRDQLRTLHARICSEGPMDFGTHHFLISARRLRGGSTH